MVHMSEMPQSGRAVPTVTLGWRLQMALTHAAISRAVIADVLGVDVSTASRWMNDRGAPPKKAFIQQWAMATGVDPEWLITGAAASDFSDPTRTSVEGQPNTGWFSLAASHGAEMSEAATRQGNRRRLVAARAA